MIFFIALWRVLGDYESTLGSIDAKFAHDDASVGVELRGLLGMDPARAVRDLLVRIARFPLCRGRWLALDAMSRIEDEEAVSALVQGACHDQDLRLALSLNFSDAANREIIRLCRSSSEEIRVWAIDQVGRRKLLGAVDALLPDTLSEPVRRSLFGITGKSFQTNQEWVSWWEQNKQRLVGDELKLDRRLERLVADLGDDGFVVREEATKELLKLGVKSGKALVRALAVKDPEVQERARRCLDELQTAIGGVPSDPAPSTDSPRSLLGVGVVDSEGVRVLEGSRDLLPGDLILQVCNTIPRDASHFSQLLQRAGSGETVTLLIRRNREELGKKITLGRLHEAVGKPVQLSNDYETQYAGGGASALTDGWLASEKNLLSGWQGYLSDIEAVIDLGGSRPIRQLQARFLQQVSAGIFLPRQVEFFISEDGRHFDSVAVVKNETPRSEVGPLVRVFSASVNLSARFIRVRAPTVARTWLFTDEILVNPK